MPSPININVFCLENILQKKPLTAGLVNLSKLISNQPSTYTKELAIDKWNTSLHSLSFKISILLHTHFTQLIIILKTIRIRSVICVFNDMRVILNMRSIMLKDFSLINRDQRDIWICWFQDFRRQSKSSPPCALWNSSGNLRCNYWHAENFGKSRKKCTLNSDSVHIFLSNRIEEKGVQVCS